MKRCESCPYYGKEPIRSNCPVPKNLPSEEDLLQRCAIEVGRIVATPKYRRRPVVIPQSIIRASVLRRMEP